MSYEGFSQYLCKSGHLHEEDSSIAYSETPTDAACRICGEAFVWRHDVDVTNGYDERHPSTCRAELKEIGFDDQWGVDHYGNRYAVKKLRYTPADESLWVNIAEEQKRHEEYRKSLSDATRWSVAWWCEEENDFQVIYMECSGDIGTLSKIGLDQIIADRAHPGLFQQEQAAMDFLARHGDWILQCFKKEILAGQGQVQVIRTVDPEFKFRH